MVWVVARLRCVKDFAEYSEIDEQFSRSITHICLSSEDAFACAVTQWTQELREFEEEYQIQPHNKMWKHFVALIHDAILQKDVSVKAYWRIERAARNAGISRGLCDSKLLPYEMPPCYIDVAMHGVDNKAYAESNLSLYAPALNPPAPADDAASPPTVAQLAPKVHVPLIYPKPTSDAQPTHAARTPQSQSTFGSSLKDAY